METPYAVYTIACDEGIDISKYLTGKETAEVRDLMVQLRSASQTKSSSGTVPRKRKCAAKSKNVVIKIAGLEIDGIPGLKPMHATEAKQMAEKVYPMLYIFENSVRDIIERVLTASYGSDWWDIAVTKKVQEVASQRKDAQSKDQWHGARGQREIDYVDLSHLWLIVKHKWDLFKDLFPSQAWIESLITSEMNVSRRPIAHMNPISSSDVENVEAAFRKWVRQLQGVASSIP